MKTILTTIFTLSVGIFLSTTLQANPENLQQSLQSAINTHDQKVLYSFFNSQGITPKTKKAIEETIKEICSWENVKVTVEPFKGRRLEEFKKTKTALNGNPAADVVFKATDSSQKYYSMLAGPSDNGFLILFPKNNE